MPIRIPGEQSSLWWYLEMKRCLNRQIFQVIRTGGTSKSGILPKPCHKRCFWELVRCEKYFGSQPAHTHWTPLVLGSGIRLTSDSTRWYYASFDLFLHGQTAPNWNLAPVLAFRLYRCAQQLRNKLFSKFTMELVSKLLLMSVLAKRCHF